MTEHSPSVDRITAFAVRLPLERPVHAGRSLLASRDYLCVELTRNDGVRGIGFSYIGTSGAESALTIVREMMGPSLLAPNIALDDPKACWRAMQDATRIQGRCGIVMNALSALDIAIWDALARSRSEPLASVLGAAVKRVPAYASGGYYRTEDGVDELLQELEQWRALGFTRVKLKARGCMHASEFVRLRSARDILGPDALVMLDFYHAWEERSPALLFVQAATAFDPYWIEDPFPADDLQSFAWLARKSGLRLATGEFQSSPLAIEYAGMIGAASVIQVEAPRCGGVTGWLQIARVADRHGMTMCPCWFHQLHAHLVPSIPNGQFVEYFHGTDVLNFERLIDRSSTLADGCVAIPDLPGLGFEFDDDCIRRHCVAQLELRHRH